MSESDEWYGERHLRHGGWLAGPRAGRLITALFLMAHYDLPSRPDPVVFEPTSVSSRRAEDAGISTSAAPF